MGKKKVKEADSAPIINHDRPVTLEQKPQQDEPVDEKTVGLERELRRYVKRTGGFRKDLSPGDTKKAEAIMKELDREKPEWDVTIIVPGFEYASNK